MLVSAMCSRLGSGGSRRRGFAAARKNAEYEKKSATSRVRGTLRIAFDRTSRVPTPRVSAAAAASEAKRREA